jgi:hypothetical protein
MCKNTKGLDYFDNVKKQYPEINNFENMVTDDRYFASCGHLNNEGAIIYTNHIINTFFK